MKLTKNTVKRAVRTFFQSAIAYITVNALCISYGAENGGLEDALIGLAISAAAAGIAAVMNLERNEE